MADVRIITTTGGERTLTGAVVETFKTKLRGELLRPNDTGYDGARQVWNAMIDKRPALIVCCAGVADVRRTVEFARTHNLLLSVRGGGAQRSR